MAFVTLLARRVDAVLPALQRSAASCIQFMFANFDPERLRETVGAERCSFGIRFVQAHLNTVGKAKAATGATEQKA